MKIRTLLRTSARRSALRAGRILIPPPSLGSIPSPHDGEVGRGSGRGDFKRARQFDGTSPSPQPSPRSSLAGRGEHETSAMVGVSRCARIALSHTPALAPPPVLVVNWRNMT